jgi:hypothetical protein
VSGDSAAVLVTAPGVEAHVQRLVDAAPPLSEEQRARLAVLLRPGSPVTVSAPRTA